MNKQKKIPPCEGKLYTVQPGDTLYTIAEKFDFNVHDIIMVNPQIENSDEIYSGQVICLPQIAVYKECAIVLTPSREAGVALPDILGGVVLVQKINENKYALTFSAVGLPDPGTIGDGNFNTYIGSININGQKYSALLEVTAPFEQEATWAGTRIINTNPFDYPSSTVTVVPFNLERGIRTNPVLGGMIADCKK